jgi:hypothetical protein
LNNDYNNIISEDLYIPEKIEILAYIVVYRAGMGQPAANAGLRYEISTTRKGGCHE